jgi:hypothetical protein
MSCVAATLYDGSRVDRSRYPRVDHRERQLHFARRSDDTDASSGVDSGANVARSALMLSPRPAVGNLLDLPPKSGSGPTNSRTGSLLRLAAVHLGEGP